MELLSQVPKQPFLNHPCGLKELGFKHKPKLLEYREGKGAKKERDKLNPGQFYYC